MRTSELTEDGQRPRTWVQVDGLEADDGGLVVWFGGGVSGQGRVSYRDNNRQEGLNRKLASPSESAWTVSH